MEKIKVAVRAMPLLPEGATTTHWKVVGNSISYPDSELKFEFDRIYMGSCETVDVYNGIAKDIVSNAVKGYNGTVFAYGQTNSGKTHTMFGSNTEMGVIELSVYDMFHMTAQETNREFLLRVGYLEIYNDEIRDLLVPKHQNLMIRENPERGVFVSGLKEEIVTSPEQVFELMQIGGARRHIGGTNMNHQSSRSHTIFRMIIESRDKVKKGNSEGGSCDPVCVSMLNLVDLAGSERVGKTCATGDRFKEGNHINQSLTALGTVIEKLSGSQGQGVHVPYRACKLTRILQSSLGGNSKTALICTITLAEDHVEETKSSLVFASRAKCVTNCASINELETDASVLKRQKKIVHNVEVRLQGSPSDHIKKEILNLRRTLLDTEIERDRIASALDEANKGWAASDQELHRLQDKVNTLSCLLVDGALVQESAELKDMKVKYHGLLLQSELQRAMSTAEIDILKGRLEEANNKLSSFESVSEANSVLVRQLEGQISLLEKSSSLHQHVQSQIFEVKKDEHEKVVKELEVCRQEYEAISKELALAKEKEKLDRDRSAEKTKEIKLLITLLGLGDKKGLSEDALETLASDDPDASDIAENLEMKLDAEVLDVDQGSLDDDVKVEANCTQEYFIARMLKNNVDRGRVTVPAAFVRRNDIRRYHSCLLLVDDQQYEMKIISNKDTRSTGAIDVRMWGDLSLLMRTNNFRCNSELKFIIDVDETRSDHIVHFHVMEA